LYTSEALTCTECGTLLAFSAAEREFFARTSVGERPQRCRDCHRARRTQRGSAWNIILYTVTCNGCAKPVEVQFQLRNDAPVYCADCMAETR